LLPCVAPAEKYLFGLLKSPKHIWGWWPVVLWMGSGGWQAGRQADQWLVFWQASRESGSCWCSNRPPGQWMVAWQVGSRLVGRLQQHGSGSPPVLSVYHGLETSSMG
jgi:hypothetical protein